MAGFRSTHRGRLVIPIPAFWYRLSRRRRVILLLALLAIVALAIAWISRGAVSDEERVKAAILKAINSAEEESIDGIATAFSPQYHGYYGSDYNDLLTRVKRDFTLISDLRIRVKDWNISIQGTYANVDLRFRFRLIYDKLGPYSNVPIDRLHPETPSNADEQARLILQNEQGQWRIIELRVDVPAH